MLKNILLFVLVVAASFSSICFADESPSYGYIGIGAGSIRANIKPSPGETTVVNTAGVDSTSSIDKTAFAKNFVIGYCFNRYICTELGYIDDIELSTSTQINSYNGAPATFNWAGNTVIIAPNSITLNGVPYNFTNGAIDARFQRKLKVSIVEPSVMFKYPVRSNIDVFLRVADFHYNAEADYVLSVPNSQNIYLGKTDYEKGDILAASIGARWAVTTQTQLGIEYYGNPGNSSGTKASMLIAQVIQKF